MTETVYAVFAFIQDYLVDVFVPFFLYHDTMGLVLFTTAFSAGISVLSAMAADAFLTQRIGMFGSFLGLQHSYNSGVAFGIHLPPLVQGFLIGLALILVVWLALSPVRPSRFRGCRIAYGLILGGGMANIIDRLRDGMVTDYFQVGAFPIFNVADICITVGVLMLLIEMMVLGRRKL